MQKNLKNAKIYKLIIVKLFTFTFFKFFVMGLDSPNHKINVPLYVHKSRIIINEYNSKDEY